MIFRGILLRSVSKYVSFGLANTVPVQAGLFAAAHLDLAAIPYLFVFGLVAGTLARRSGGLLAPMILHALFNLVAGALVLIPD